MEEYYKALNGYYSLKRKYETQNYTTKKKFLSKNIESGKVLNELKSEYNKEIPKCIHCKRNVGTIFVSVVEDTHRILKAICGDAIHPCSLNIQLKTGDVSTYPDYIHLFEKELDVLKNKIIDDKNKLLFGYIDTEKALDLFENVKAEITTITDILYHYIENYTEITDNPLKKEELIRKEKEMYGYIDTIKNAIEEKDNRKANVKYALEVYTHDLVPILKEISALKYKYQQVKKDEDGVYYLVQKKYTIKDLEKYAIEPEIIRFDVKKEKNLEKRKQTRKNVPKINNVNKTRKIKIIEEEDTEEE